MLLPIETKMEVFARTYSKDTGVNVYIGSKFCTDGKNIWVVPIKDQTNEWIRFETEVGVYHETGHVITKDVMKMPLNTVPANKRTPVLKTKHSIANAVRDVCIEQHMETKFPGMRPKWIKFLTTYVKKNTNKSMAGDSVSPFKKLMWMVYLRAREIQLGIDVGLVVPDEIEEIFQARLAQFIDEVAKHKTVKESLDLTERIYEALQMEEPEPEENEDENDKNQGSGNASNGEGDPQPNEGDDDEEDEPSGGNGDENKDDGDEDEDKNGGGGKGDDEEDEDGDPAKPQLSDDAKDALDEVQDEMDDGADNGGIGEEISNHINQYADNAKLYREVPGLKEDVVEIDETSGWEHEVSRYEQKGREITGYIGRKMKVLFISERAPRWVRNLRTGRLDPQKLTKLIRHGSLEVCKRRTEMRYDDSAVYLIGDHSCSMNDGTKDVYTQSILTSMSSDLDKLRIPFEAIGFTCGSMTGQAANNGIRSQPITIHVIKRFEEAYRRVRHRYVWPSYNGNTAELPAIIYGVKRLVQRRETKKVLFVLSDGETFVSNSNMQDAMHKATIEYIERIKRAGIKVVLIGLQDTYMLKYDPEAIIINDVSEFASQFYNRLMKILL